MLLYLVIVFSPPAACWLLLRLPRLLRRFRRPTPAPSHPPIEKVAADLRRLHRLLTHFGPGTPVVRRRGTLQAYDALLIQACIAIDIPHQLDHLPPGLSLELERLRVEESLKSAGLVIR
jgi:hypothetical protein